MKAPRISEAEWRVMKAVWKAAPAPCRAQEVLEELAKSTKWTPATIKTLLNRLIHKGALKFTKSGKAYLYSPAYTEEQFREAESNSFLNRVFDGAISPMVAHFVNARKLSPSEIESLEKILKDCREKP